MKMESPILPSIEEESSGMQDADERMSGSSAGVAGTTVLPISGAFGTTAANISRVTEIRTSRMHVDAG